MKTREGFVSNSSTTSFVCEVCTRAGTDEDSYEYCDDCECYFHDDCADKFKDITTSEKRLDVLKQLMNEHDYDELANNIEENKRAGYGFNDYLERAERRAEIKHFKCPICDHKIVSADKMVDFLLKRFGVSKEDMVGEFYLEKE